MGVVFLFVSVSPLLAQPGPDPTPARTAELGLSFGFTAVHRPEMWSAVTSHAFGGSATLLRPAAGAWTTAGRRGLRPPPLEGLELAFTSAGGPGVGPQAHAVWIVRHPLSQRSAFEAGTGIGWAFAPYDPDLRPGNFILGSHLNAALRLGLFTTPFPHLRLGLAFTHLSNGSFAQPNLGTNLLTARAALILPTLKLNLNLNLNLKLNLNLNLNSPSSPAPAKPASPTASGTSSAGSKRPTRIPCGAAPSASEPQED